GDPDLRVSALRALAGSGDKRGVEVMIGALRDGNAAVRETAIYGLGSLRSDKARDALIDFSRTQDAGDRRSAVLALRDYSDPRAQQRIVELARDPDASVRNYAMDYMPDTQAGAAVLKSILNDVSLDMNTRIRAAQSLRYRSYLDESTTAMIESVEADYYHDYRDY
ncbi:MAG TPA: HEAT repeat domain-containing protein, partial [Kofleriaceae bacterium]|nr:HEAT repeat domain-containing protein [Kofleriaceae bacterium]